MNIGVIITMYDEETFVLSSIINIKKNYEQSTIIVVHSDNQKESDSLNKIKEIVDDYVLLPDLSKFYSRFELPSQAITRNFNEGAKKIYQKNIDFDFIVFLTGDSLITDSNSFGRRFEEMKENKWVSMVSKAVGCDFHSKDSNPEIGNNGGRYQEITTTDFACCFFIIDGSFGKQKLAFSNTSITNKWTSEQCLGDELIRALGDVNNFHIKVGTLNSQNLTYAYSYNDGIIYHAKSGKPNR